MNLVFFNDRPKRFLPLTFTRPLAKLRFGILSVEQKWEHHFKQLNLSSSHSYLTADYLSNKYPASNNEQVVYVNERYMPNKELVHFIHDNLIDGEALFEGDALVCARCSKEQFDQKSYIVKDTNQSLIGTVLNDVTDLFRLNGEVIESDFNLLTAGRSSEEISRTNTIIGDRVFLEQGANVEAAILNSTEGPIYIGRNAEVMEGSMIRGGFALCEGGVVKLGAKIYGPTTIGAFSKVGGEVTNCVVQDYSNKGHDGFIGNSLIGSWCNLGADTNTSNLKNNYSNVRKWDYETMDYKDSGLQFCGVIMGDHTKCGINTMFNTGTVVGVSANVFDAGFPPKFVPSFSWGGKDGILEYKLDKMFETAQRVMERRGVEFDSEEKAILTAIFEQTAANRK